MNEEIRVTKMLEENGVYADVYTWGGFIAVEINWGDWKHEHWRAKWLMEEAGYTQIKEVETEENGTDCYSAIHYFFRAA